MNPLEYKNILKEDKDIDVKSAMKWTTPTDLRQLCEIVSVCLSNGITYRLVFGNTGFGNTFFSTLNLIFNI